jgi:uncharacterized damage-inducible protein DinB
MTPPDDLHTTLLASWRTNARVTTYLVENLPPEIWEASVPGEPRRTIRMIAVHLHNVRCMWLKTLGTENKIAVPANVDRRTATRRQLLVALGRSSKGIEALLELGLTRGGRVPPTKAYVWRNLPLDVPHVLTYFIAHEGHHRGQIVMVARQLGHRLSIDVTGGLWHWIKRAQETQLPAAASVRMRNSSI